MASLIGLLPENTYNQVLQIGSGNIGLTTAVQTVQDGAGTNSVFGLSTLGVYINGNILVRSGSSSLTLATTGITTATFPTGSITLVPTAGTGATGTWSISVTGNAATVTTNANLTGPITSVGNATSIAPSPSFTTPLLGTPTSGVLTNCTGTAAGLTAGTCTTIPSLSGDVSSSSNAVTVTKINGATLGTTTATSANILVANGSQWGSVAMSGDTTISTAGAVTIGANKISLSKMATQSAHTVLANTTGSTAVPSAVATSGFLQSLPVMQVFITSGTYTPTAGMVYCIVECYGAGGGSGGCALTGVGQYAVSTGGGGGGYSRSVLSAATIGASQTVTIGAGGLAGTAGANTGGTGGTTSVGSLVIALGGPGGVGGAASAVAAPTGTLGAAAGTGQVTGQGQASAIGVSYFAGGFLLSGAGANSSVGQGGLSTVNAVGAAGTGFASGGSGSSSVASLAAKAGAAGALGLVIITEFVAV